MRSLADGFWPKVTRGEGCWEWAGAPTRLGYGRFQANGQEVLAHRASWELHNGPIPDGLCVLHRCDNRICVRPDHLFLGTKGDNARDAQAKGRNSRGEVNGNARLTEAQVRTIRDRLASGASLSVLAREFGIGKAAVSHIKTGRAWAWLT